MSGSTSDDARAPRCLVVTPRHPTGPDDWRARFVAEHTAALAAALGPQNVRLLAPHDAWVAPETVHLPWRPPPGILAPHGAPERLAAAPLRAGAAGLLATARLAAAARRHRQPPERQPPEICVAHWIVPGALAARAHGGPAVIYAHGGDVAVLERLAHWPGLRRLLRSLDRRTRWVAVSAPLAARLAALLAPRPADAAPIAVCPMGVATPRPDPHFAMRVRARAAGRPVVATVGRLVPIKGLDVLAAALAHTALAHTALAQHHRPRDTLWIAAGTGPEAAHLQRLAAAHRLDLWLPGDLAPAARDALLAEATVFVQPSRPLPSRPLPSRPLPGRVLAGRAATRTEGTPVALLEALVSGVPTVATDTGGQAAVLAQIQGPHAGPVPPDDPAALAQALRAVLDLDPEARARWRQAHAQAGAAFTWANLGPIHAALVRAAAR